MLYLYPESTKIKKAKYFFLSKMETLLYQRIDNVINEKGKYQNHIVTFFDTCINSHLQKILVGDPFELNAINSQLNPYIHFLPDLKKSIEYVFNYDWFISKCKTRYCAYNLADDLDVRTCVYCNRNYTNTVISDNKKRKIIRPQFDHYLEKDSNPLLAISFYNLIPCCSICNSSIKNIQKFNLNEYLHPYIDNEIDSIKFTYKFSNETKSGLKIEVNAPTSPKSIKTLEAFAIEEVYSSHTQELLELIKTNNYFSDNYLNILSSNILKGIVVSKEEMYRIAFGSELKKESFVNRPFSKFKSDILLELGVIDKK